MKKNDIKRSYQSLPSLADRLPWRDYNEELKCILLEDNESLGVCFKIRPIACEARPEAMLNEIAKLIGEAIKNSIPCEKNNPWILQFYINKESDLSKSYAEIENYFPEERKSTELTKAYLKNLNEHFDYVTRENGIFYDSQVTNQNFRGGILHVNAVLYRRKNLSAKKENARRSRLEEIDQIARKFIDQLRICGVHIHRMQGNEFYDWMMKWFNPKQQHTGQKCIGLDLAEQLFFSVPESFEKCL
jgi:hypothetical protein